LMNFIQKLIRPRLPSAAVGLSGESAAVVSLERRRDALVVKRAAHVALSEGLVTPSFDELNVADPRELADVLGELVTSAGMPKRHRWSVALPEGATRTAILTMEGAPSSSAEREEMLRWKTERSFGTALDELRVTRQRLRPDAQGRTRYLASAVRLPVLNEYEAVFASLDWHAGLVLPRHMGEAWWLMKNRAATSDALVVSAHPEGFTAVLLRAGQPLLVRSVACDAEDCSDELYRFLLFYRDRLTALPAAESDAGAPAGETIEQLLVAGHGIEPQQAARIVEETLSVAPRLVHAEDVRLALPAGDLSFGLVAAPAGLAALAYA
ncbi:MAG: hypothetical protein ACRD9R_14775, partial [Pyrinomonadaceae bacterium]